MPRPVVVGGRKGFCSRAIPGPGPSQNPALCGSPPAKCSSASASYWCEGGTTLGALALVRATCRLSGTPALDKEVVLVRCAPVGNFLVVAPVLGRSAIKSQQSRGAGQLAFAVSTPRYGFAVLYLAAIPPHLCRGEPRQTTTEHLADEFPGSSTSSSSWSVVGRDPYRKNLSPC